MWFSYFILNHTWNLVQEDFSFLRQHFTVLQRSTDKFQRFFLTLKLCFILRFYSIILRELYSTCLCSTYGSLHNGISFTELFGYLTEVFTYVTLSAYRFTYNEFLVITNLAIANLANTTYYLIIEKRKFHETYWFIYIYPVRIIECFIPRGIQRNRKHSQFSNIQIFSLRASWAFECFILLLHFHQQTLFTSHN